MIKIAITGPECSGKSSLAEELALHYGASMVPEYAREYLQNIGSNYDYQDVVEIAKKQIELEETAEKEKTRLMVCDTDSINLKIWFEFYDFKVPDFIIKHVESRPYNLSLLLSPNIVWKADGIRKNPTDREELYHLFEKNLQKYEYNYKKVKKLNEGRHQEGIEFIDAYLYGFSL